MTETLLVKNNTFLEILESEEYASDFVSIIELLRKKAYKISLASDDIINIIFAEIHNKAIKNDDIRLISKLLEKNFEFMDSKKHNELLSIINERLDEESKSFKHILDSIESFDYKNKLIGYRVYSKEGIRNTSNLDELKMFFLILCMEKDNIKEFVKEIKIILDNIIFDEDIEDSIRSLNDGFDKRKNEIIYHLYVIHTEIPGILESGIRDYRGIGQCLSIGCSPERSRATVNNTLTKIVDSCEINCELHTKMKKLSSNAPDRIYFSPKLPMEVGEEKKGKIFVYKITNHV